LVKATIEGVKIEPSLFSRAFGSPSIIEAYFVIAVPRSIPKILPYVLLKIILIITILAY